MAKTPSPSIEKPKTINADARVAAIDAMMALAAERAWNNLAMADIAERAGLSLAALRELFPSKGAILAALARRIDQEVLEAVDSKMKNEPSRARLCHILMRRLDILEPYKPGLRALREAFRIDPIGLAALNRVALTSMQWMLAAASIPSEGPRGLARAQGLVLAWSRVLAVWFEDESEDLCKTKAEIDRQLRAAEWWVERVSDIGKATESLRAIACNLARDATKVRDCLRNPSIHRQDADHNRAGAEAI